MFFKYVMVIFIIGSDGSRQSVDFTGFDEVEECHDMAAMMDEDLSPLMGAICVSFEERAGS